jgi:diguanylate cyclase (GGDEF)-like protein
VGSDILRPGGRALDRLVGIARIAPTAFAPSRGASTRATDEALDRWVADALGPVGIVLAVMYTLSVANRATDPAIAATTPPTAAVLVVTFLGMGLLVLRRPLPGPLAHPLFAGALGLIMLEALIRGPQIAASDLPWAIIGSGAVALRPRWYAAALGMVIVPFALVVAVIPASPWAATTATYRLDFLMASLLASVVFVARRRALVRLELAKADLREAAHEDPLTSLPNRRGLAAAATPIREHARRTGEMVRVGFVDLDGFKAVNDADGHAVGDAVLCLVAAAIREAVRGSDVVARVGGDEFAIVAPGLAETRALDARLEEAVRRATSAAGHEVGVSIGWCSIESEDRRPILDLVDEADRVMYAARHRRRDVAPLSSGQVPEVARVA